MITISATINVQKFVIFCFIDSYLIFKFHYDTIPTLMLPVSSRSINNTNNSQIKKAKVQSLHDPRRV